jgi:hypothetical protein
VVDVTIPFSTFLVSPFVQNSEIAGGWKYTTDPSTIAKDYTLGGVAYTLRIMYTFSPSEIVLYFNDMHSSQSNTYGKVSNIVIDWEAG